MASPDWNWPSRVDTLVSLPTLVPFPRSPQPLYGVIQNTPQMLTVCIALRYMSRARAEAHLAFWHKESLVCEELTSHHFQAPDALNHDSSEHVAAIRTVPLQRIEGGGTPAPLEQPLAPGCQKRKQEEPGRGRPLRKRAAEWVLGEPGRLSLVAEGRGLEDSCLNPERLSGKVVSSYPAHM